MKTKKDFANFIEACPGIQLISMQDLIKLFVSQFVNAFVNQIVDR